MPLLGFSDRDFTNLFSVCILFPKSHIPQALFCCQFYSCPDKARSPIMNCRNRGSRYILKVSCCQATSSKDQKVKVNIVRCKLITILVHTCAGDATRISPSHESYLLSAETDEERKDWIRAIKQFLYSVSGGGIVHFVYM